MQQNDVAKQMAKIVALSALFLLPITPFIVTSSFFFPFITGKAFYLRILIEIAVVAWGILALLDKAYRPRFSWLGATVTAFVLWMFVADAFAPNTAKAFWSNFERMEGWVLLAHLLGLFFAASAVLRVEKKWRAWFFTSLGVALVVSAYALLQLNNPQEFPIHQGSTRIDASLGNSAYLAVYLLFNVFISLWLALTEKQVWLKYSLIAFAALEAVLIFFTETRGAIIGLVVALFISAAATALTGSMRARRVAGFACAGILLLVSGFYLARDSSIVQNNSSLQRIASISLADGQTRFTIWSMAWQGFKERPLTGWGQEGFNYVFNKYYDPSLYGQETWFDRAHNAFIDWLSAGGLPAFFLYISLFMSAIVLLWRHSEFSRPERVLLTAALVGYAVHNVFVFDNLYSYIYFFAILALIDSQSARPIRALETAPEVTPESGMLYALPIGAVIAFALVWFVNVPGIRAAGGLARAISPSQNGVDGNLALFKELVRNPSFAAQEIREQLVSFASAVVQSPSVDTETKKETAILAITEMQKQVARYPEDARERLQLAYAFRIVGYTKDTLEQVKVALILSPQKEQMWLEAGQVAWDAGDVKEVQAAFNKAYELAPRFKDLAQYAAAGNIVAGDVAAADRILNDAYGSVVVDSDVLSVAYYRTKNWTRLVSLWRLRAERPSASAQTWFGLASVYFAAGDKANAIKTIRKAVELFPESSEAGAAAISEIEGKASAQ